MGRAAAASRLSPAAPPPASRPPLPPGFRAAPRSPSPPAGAAPPLAPVQEMRKRRDLQLHVFLMPKGGQERKMQHMQYLSCRKACFPGELLKPWRTVSKFSAFSKYSNMKEQDEIFCCFIF
ncbi:chromosome segregation in meiosis protein 3-like isoform X1 [Tyto alba]|uniref:chromosome segregation in meiosis protein 3-like isoform X1 n=1 Tax=Tyto alba TaxID=56313 RepID=UPI001C686880|nr:chromosome segregation in meiosis protein 3-like isoform X1 [Tyto alba]